MISALEAVGWAVGTLAAFGVIMTGLNLLAQRGVPGVRSWVEDRSPIVYGLTILAVLAILISSGRLDPADYLRLGPPVPFLAAIAAAPVIAVIMYVVELSLSSRSVRPAGLITAPNAQQATVALTSRPVVWWSLAGVSAVVEELIFRGLLLAALTASFGWWAAVAVSALLFGLHHVTFGAVSVVSKTVGGVLLALQVIVAGSILPAVVAHLIFQGLVWRRLVRTGGLR